MMLAEIVDAAKEFAETANKHDDRWLMLLMLGIVIAGAALAIRYLTKSNEKQRASHEITSQKLIDVLLEQNTKLTEVVTRNTDSINANSLIMVETNRLLGKVSARSP